MSSLVMKSNYRRQPPVVALFEVKWSLHFEVYWCILILVLMCVIFYQLFRCGKCIRRTKFPLIHQKGGITLYGEMSI